MNSGSFDHPRAWCSPHLSRHPVGPSLQSDSLVPAVQTYLLYYLLTFLISYGVRNPYVLLFAGVLLVGRGFIPDPSAIFRAFARSGHLRREIASNPANATARRDLARILLDLRRPKAAFTVIAEARKRFPKDRELAHLEGVSLCRMNDPEAALRSLAVACGMSADGSFLTPSRPDRAAPGVSATTDILLLAASANEALGKWQEAEHAYEAAAELNTSSLEPIVRLAALRKRRGDRPGTHRALTEASATWAALPAYARRKQWRWRIQALVQTVL
jgi:hypothetical protein